MSTNPILQELYAARAEIMAEYGNDLRSYLRDAAERNAASDHPVAKIKQRTLRRNGPAERDNLPVADVSVRRAERNR